MTTERIRQIFKALENGDGAAFFAHIAADVDWTVMGTHPLAGHYHSRAGYTGTFVKLGKVLPQGAQLHVEHVLVKDDEAVVELRSLAKAKNGMRFDNRYCMVLTFVNVCDLYLFQGAPDSTVMAMTVNPDVVLSAPDALHVEGLYAFRLDLTGDAREDVVFKFSFGKNRRISHHGTQEPANETCMTFPACNTAGVAGISDYPALNACIGSTRDARHAGTIHANAATASSVTATAA
jgi:ketosteroid isomerase-like protein